MTMGAHPLKRRGLSTVVLVSALALTVPLIGEAGLIQRIQPPDVTTTVNEPVRVTALANGHTLVDFGRDAAGCVMFSAPSSAVGGTYEMTIAEALNADGTGVNDTAHAGAWNCWYSYVKDGSGKQVECSLRSIRLTGSVASAGQFRVPMSLPWQTRFDGNAHVKTAAGNELCPFRYIEVASLPPGVSASDLRRVMSHYPFNYEDSSFTSSDENLNKVYDLCKWSLYADSYLGYWLDGDRERQFYQGDAYVSVLDSVGVFSDMTMNRRTAAEFFIDELKKEWSVEWWLYTFLTAYQDYYHSGDISTLSTYYDHIKPSATTGKFYKVPSQFQGTDGLLASPSSWQSSIIDWPQMYRYQYDMGQSGTNGSDNDDGRLMPIENALLCQQYRDLAATATALGKASEASDYAAMAEKIFNSYQTVFFDGSCGLYRDKANVNGYRSAHHSIQANAAALAFGMVPADKVAAVAKFVAEEGMNCSVYFAHHVLEGLCRAGRVDAAIDYMTSTAANSWMNMIREGHTTCCETWSIASGSGVVGGAPDLNHPWSCAPASIIPRYVLGVKPAAAGWTKAAVKPSFGGLTFASGKVPTAKGPVEVAYANRTLTVKIPSAMPSATVEFAGQTRTASGGETVTISEADAPPVVPTAYLPTAKTGLKYNGQTQTGVSAGEGCAVTGNTGTDAGSYTATVTLADGYVWSDGNSSKTRPVTWSIAKGANSWTTQPSVSPTSWVEGETPSVTISNGANAFGVAVTCDRTAAQLMAMKGGESATVTFTAADGGNNYDAITKQVKVSVKVKGSDEPATGEELIQNGDFEEWDVNKILPRGYAVLSTWDGQVWTGNTFGLNNDGAYADMTGKGHCSTGESMEGSFCASLQASVNEAWMEQEVTVPADGTYRLAFIYQHRNNKAENPSQTQTFTVTLAKGSDELAVVTSVTVTDIDLHAFSEDVGLTAGAWKLRVSNAPATKSTILFDNFSLKAVGGGGDVHVHSFGAYAVTTPATCEGKGVETATCACGETVTREIAALGHDWGEWETVTPAAETTDGEKCRTCRRTGCNAVESETIPATGGELIRNGGFEDCGSVAVPANRFSSLAKVTYPSWTGTAPASGSDAAVSRQSGATAYWYEESMTGQFCLAIQRKGQARQEGIVIPADGTYRLSFICQARLQMKSSWVPNPAPQTDQMTKIEFSNGSRTVTVDEALRLTDGNLAEKSYDVVLTAGMWTLTLEGLVDSSDVSTLFDNFSLKTVGGGEEFDPPEEPDPPEESDPSEKPQAATIRVDGTKVLIGVSEPKVGLEYGVKRTTVLGSEDAFTVDENSWVPGESLGNGNTLEVEKKSGANAEFFKVVVRSAEN